MPMSLIMVGLLATSCGGGEYIPPSIDVDSIDVSSLNLKKDTLGGEIKSDAESVYFDFYEVSDFHGAVNYDVDDRTIGLAKMANYFATKRAENPGGTIVLSSGDMYQGSAESNLTHGYIVNYSMNIMGFESMTVGNHEFDWTLDWLKKNQSTKIGDYSIPYLGANVFDKSTGKILDFLKPSVTISRGDYKVGIIGTLGDGAEKSIMKSLVESLEFKPELPIVKLEAAKLKSEGCDIIVWSSHRDAQELSTLGSLKSFGIDAVFGGHSHQNVGPHYVSGVPYLETQNYGRGIAHAQLKVKKSTKEVTCVEENTAVDVEPYQHSELVEHAEVKKVVDLYNGYIDPIKNQKVGSTNGVLDVYTTFSLTNLCVETMAEEGIAWAKENMPEAKIIASFHNSKGGVRANIEEGDVTFGNVYKSFPFDNEVVVVKATGVQMQKYCKNAASFGAWRDVEEFSYSSWSKIPATATFYFVTTDFVAGNYFSIPDDGFTRTGIIVRDAVAKKFFNSGKIKTSNYERSADNPQFSLYSK